MLNNFLENLRQKEIQEQINIKSDPLLKFNFDIRMNTRIARYIRDNFNIVEHTVHFYDCETYDNIHPITWKQKMKFNNWIDVVGPGIWFQTLEEANKDSFDDMLNELKRKHWEEYKNKTNNEHRWHIFLYDNVIFLYWFGRDIETFYNNDKWWIYELKDKADMIDCSYFCYYNYERTDRLNEKH